MKAKESLFLLLSGITAFTVLMTGASNNRIILAPTTTGRVAETDSITLLWPMSK